MRGSDLPPRAERPAPPRGAPGRRPNRFRRLAMTAFVVVLLLAAGALLLLWQTSPPSQNPVVTEFEVLPGWGAARVARELERDGLIRNRRLFTLWLRLNDLDRSIGEGLYDLAPTMSTAEVAERLSQGGRPRTVRVVVPEGFRGRDVAARLAASGLGDEERYLQLIADPGDLRPDFVPEGAGLEGYLFPASYDIPVNDTPEGVLERFLQRFGHELDALAAEVRARDLSPFEWVTLASMVQAEAGDTSEMPVVAGVFLNRLDRDMLLQSDPTVAYGLGKDLPDLDVGAGDFRRDHPWNTYLHPGLPAGPIANPGRAALEAVLEPVRTTAEGEPYLYFLHGREDGRPVFRPNTRLEDHNRDVRLYLQAPSR